eukprot:CAMPEP_0183460990 /NCGR_PEP_ID=MMETSP0370-20130417/138765_1 /TAXON_ID=268820 /ORGANISM="Peridinium aciculiferum, Strain PAER-2" /LENGTH=65 /DNA_ID=CAMNT_0025652925 /DNA_START=246 /DNA_END=442 /DNA_ORIENTATION=-
MPANSQFVEGDTNVKRTSITGQHELISGCASVSAGASPSEGHEEAEVEKSPEADAHVRNVGGAYV